MKEATVDKASKALNTKYFVVETLESSVLKVETDVIVELKKIGINS